jgi:hypothetical protein
MRLATFAVLALAGAASAAAQTRQEPNIVLTIFGGYTTGHDLWVVGKQPLQVIGSSPAEYDTLRLSQSIGPSIIAGAAATYFPSAHLGLHVELSYMGLPVDAGCTGPALYRPDVEEKNKQTCDDIQTKASDGGAIAVFAGATFRAASRASLSPYARLNLGVVTQSRSTIEISGAFVASSGIGIREVVSDPQPRRAKVLLGGALGFTRPISPGYQFRWEVRDLIVPLNRLTGPAIPGSGAIVGPTASRLYHHFSLLLGLDVVLEKKRGRRY